MSSVRPNDKKIQFIRKIGSAAQSVKVKNFFRESKVEWADEVVLSKEVRARIEKDMSKLKVSDTSNKLRHQMFWGKFLKKNDEISHKVAIYDTQDASAEFGLVALEDIKAFEYLIYSGKWEFHDDKEKLRQLSSAYRYSIVYQSDNEVSYGAINAEQVRNYCSYLNTGPLDEKELDEYEFKNETVRNNIATANMLPEVLPRPKGKEGPPFCVIFFATRDIKKGEPLITHYGIQYFLDMKNQVEECFFDKNTGVAIDKTLYSVKDEILLRARIEELNNVISFSFNKSELLAKKPITVELEPGKFIFDHDLLQSSIDRYPRRRYIFLENSPVFIPSGAIEPIRIAPVQTSFPITETMISEDKKNPAPHNEVKSVSSAKNKDKKILFINKIGTAPQPTKIKNFFRDGKHEWSEEIVMTEEAKKRIEKDMPLLRVSDTTNKIRQLAYWSKIINGDDISHKVAIYDTRDISAKYGLTAVEDIKQYQHLVYAGVWEFCENSADTYNKDGSCRYSIQRKDDESITYGAIDASRVRNYSVYANTGPLNEEQLSKYEFKDDAVKNRVALANFAIEILPRPKGKEGPPFVVIYVALRDIKKGEPIITNYGESYLLDMQNKVDECLFDKTNGAVIDRALYGPTSKIALRIFLKDIQQHADHVFDKNDLVTKQGFTMVCPAGTIRMSYESLKAAIDRYPHSRAIFIDNPTEFIPLGNIMHSMKQLPVAEVKVAPQNNRNQLFSNEGDIGKFMRNLAYSDSSTAEQLDAFIVTQKEKLSDTLFEAFLNSAGGDTGATGLHRAAEKMHQAKINVFLKYGAKITLTDKLGKTPYDIVFRKNPHSNLLGCLTIDNLDVDQKDAISPPIVYKKE